MALGSEEGLTHAVQVLQGQLVQPLERHAPRGERLDVRGEPGDIPPGLPRRQRGLGDVYKRQAGETWADVAGFTPDIEALAARGMAFERLDQLALEHLYGVR